MLHSVVVGLLSLYTGALVLLVGCIVMGLIGMCLR